MTPEDRLRDALHAKARQFDGAPDLRDGVVSLAVARHRRRRIQVAAGSALAAAAAVAVVLAVTGAGDDSRELRVGPAGTVTTEVSSPTTVAEEVVAPTTTAAPSGRPDFVVAADEKRLVVLDRQGKIVRTILTLPPTPANPPPECCFSFGHIALSPDGKTVYFHQVGEPGAGQILRIPFTGGEPELIAQNAWNPAVSPDGAKLAYLKDYNQLVVRNLRSGGERTWDAGGGEQTQLGRVVWAPDSRRIAVTVAQNTGAGFETTVRLLDADGEPIDVVDVPPENVPASGERVDVMVGAWRGASDDLVVARYCCWPEPHFGQTDLVTFRNAQATASTPVNGWVAELDYDATGTYRLFVVLVGEDRLELRWAGGGESGSFGRWAHAAW
jgi:hypothetical protein